MKQQWQPLAISPRASRRGRLSVVFTSPVPRIEPVQGGSRNESFVSSGPMATDSGTEQLTGQELSSTTMGSCYPDAKTNVNNGTFKVL